MIVVVNLNDDALVIQNDSILEGSDDQWIGVLLVVGGKNEVKVLVFTNNPLRKMSLDGINNVFHILNFALEFDDSLCTFVERSVQVVLHQTE